MLRRLRGPIVGLLFWAFAICAAPAFASTQLAPGETTLPDGLTVLIRHATASGGVALEIWVRCPSDGWSDSQPGIARLAAFSAMSAKVDGNTMRDLVRQEGGELSVSVFQTATEFSVLAPSYAAQHLETELVRRVFAASIDPPAFEDAKTRLAEEQAIQAQSSDALLRESVFSALFAGGPLHASTVGDPNSLQSLSIKDIRDFISRSYVASSSEVIALGNVDAAGMDQSLAGVAPAAAQSAALPASTKAAAQAAPLALAAVGADAPGVALAWVGPPITDERAATAMDFLSDYLADVRFGKLALATLSAKPNASFSGQFITLQSSGIFFVTASGTGVDSKAMQASLQSALQPVLDAPIDKGAFAAAIAGYEGRLLRQMDSPVGLADNYGWYFAEGAPAYAPSATDAAMSGAYFANASALTPEFVHDVARQYLGVAPATITVEPRRLPVHVTSEG